MFLYSRFNYHHPNIESNLWNAPLFLIVEKIKKKKISSNNQNLLLITQLTEI